MNAHVLTTSTSASSGHDVISIPRCKTLPSMISASTRFFAQPRLIMPTLVRCGDARIARCAGAVLQVAADTAATTGGEFMAASVNRYVFVVIFQRLAIFCNLNGTSIENTDRYMLTAELNSAVNWRNPTLEPAIPFPVDMRQPHK